MINDFNINNFKCLSGLKLNGLKKINIFAGPNNSGKSSLLEALFLNAAPLNFKAFFHAITNRSSGSFPLNYLSILDYSKLFFSNKQGFHFSFESTLNNKTRNIECDLEYYDPHFNKNISKNSEFIISEASPSFSSTGDSGQQKLPGIEIGSIILRYKIGNEETIEHIMKFYMDGTVDYPKKVMETDIPAIWHSAIAHHFSDRGITAYSESKKSGLHKKCITLIQSMFPDINGIELLTSDGIEAPYLHVDHKELGVIPLSTQGDGVRKIYHLITSLVQCRNGIFLIDEIETSVHPSGLVKTFKWLIDECNNQNTQIFLTTHSLEAVDSLLKAVEENKDDCVLFQLRRDGKNIKAKKYEGSTLYNIRYNMGLDIRG